MNTETFDREAIRRVVDSFYTKARADETLGPIFAAQISEWPVHLERMTCFWASALLREHSYSGHPLKMHQGIPGLTVGMFARWLDLFEATIREELGEGPSAQIMIDTAKRMGRYMVQNLASSSSPVGLRPDGPLQIESLRRRP